MSRAASLFKFIVLMSLILLVFIKEILLFATYLHVSYMYSDVTVRMSICLNFLKTQIANFCNRMFLQDKYYINISGIAPSCLQSHSLILFVSLVLCVFFYKPFAHSYSECLQRLACPQAVMGFSSSPWARHLMVQSQLEWFRQCLFRIKQYCGMKINI